MLKAAESGPAGSSAAVTTCRQYTESGVRPIAWMGYGHQRENSSRQSPRTASEQPISLINAMRPPVWPLGLRKGYWWASRSGRIQTPKTAQAAPTGATSGRRGRKRAAISPATMSAAHSNSGYGGAVTDSGSCSAETMMSPAQRNASVRVRQRGAQASAR